MRMWMVPPILLCRRHLTGEHGEIHKHRHNFEKGHSVTGRVRRNQIEPSAMRDRHDALAAEIERRGGRHRSPYEQPDISYLPESERNYMIDRRGALACLLMRCPACRARMAGERQ